MEIAIASIIIAIVALAIQLWKFFEERNSKKTDHLSTLSKAADVDKEFHDLKSKIKERFEEIWERFDKLENQISPIQKLEIGQAVLEERIDGVGQSHNKIEQKLDDILEKLYDGE